MVALSARSIRWFIFGIALKVDCFCLLVCHFSSRFSSQTFVSRRKQGHLRDVNTVIRQVVRCICDWWTWGVDMDGGSARNAHTSQEKASSSAKHRKKTTVKNNYWTLSRHFYLGYHLFRVRIRTLNFRANFSGFQDSILPSVRRWKWGVWGIKIQSLVTVSPKTPCNLKK